ncbi:MAG: M42 family metallopeptidase [Planctomycetota bacterium]
MNFQLLKTLCETPGIPSREEQMRKIVIAELRPLVDSISVDTMGNVIAIRKARKAVAPGAKTPRVMIAAHMDEIGFIVKHIDDKGFIRLNPVGGFDPRVLVAQRVYVHGFTGSTLLGVLMPGQKPIHMLTPEEAGKSPKLEDLYVDLGMPADRVRAAVEIGDMVTMARTAELMGDTVVSKTLDNRLSVFVMIEALRTIGEHACDIYAVATTQEEVGLRGATTAAFALEPDIGIALDTTLANDFPGPTDPDHVTKLGLGTAIKIMDSSLICHPKLVRHFRDVADKNGIKYQLEILPRGGTDAGGIQRSRGGVPSFTLSVPSRYVHTVNEMAAVADIEATITLLARYLEDAHTRSYGYEGEAHV